jgi:hypothetical protein
MQGSEGDIGQFLKPGRLPHKHNFNIGRNSGRTKNEQPEEENGPGTNTPAEETGAVGAGGAAEEAGALGDVSGLLELAALWPA